MGKCRFLLVFFAVILSLATVLTACAKRNPGGGGGGQTERIPDPVPNGNGDMPDSAIGIFFNDYDDLMYTDVFFPDDEDSGKMEHIFSEGVAKFSIRGQGYKNGAYGSYVILLTVDTKNYRYLVFDFAEIYNTPVRIQGLDKSVAPWWYQDFFSAEEAGKYAVDFERQMPAAMRGTYTKLWLNLYIYGTEATGSYCKLNSIYSSNENPRPPKTVDDVPWRVDFEDGDEDWFYAKYNMTFGVSGGQGAFTVPPRSETDLYNGTIKLDLAIDIKTYRYLWFDIDASSTATIIVFIEGLPQSLERALDENIYKAPRSFDMNKLPEDWKDEPRVMTIRFFIYHSGTLKLNSVYTAA